MDDLAHEVKDGFSRVDREFKTVRGEISALRIELKGDIADLRTEVKGDIAELRAEVKGEIGDLRAEVKGEIGELRTEVRGDIGDLRALTMRFGIALIACLIGLIGAIMAGQPVPPGG